MQITLPPDLEQAVLAKIQSGLYRNEADIIHEALRRMLLADEGDWTLEALRREVGIGVAEAERGEFSEKNVLDIISDRQKRRRGNV